MAALSIVGSAATPAHAEYAPGAPERVRTTYKEPTSLWFREAAQTRGSTMPPSVPPPGAYQAHPVASEFYMQEHRPMPNQPSSRSIWRDLKHQMWKAKAKVGLLKSWKGVAGGATVLTAGWVGWQIGEAARPLVYGAELPTPPQGPFIPDVAGWRPVEKGEHLITINGSQQQTETILAPDYGWVARFEGTPNPVAWTITEEPEMPDCTHPVIPATETLAQAMWPVDGAPAGQWLAKSVHEDLPFGCTKHSPPQGTCTQSCNIPFTATTYARVYFTTEVPHAPEPYDLGWTQPDAGPGLQNAAEPSDLRQPDWPAAVPDWPAMQEKIADEIADNPTEYPDLIQFIDHHGGGASDDPLIVTAAAPNCAGDLYAECVEKFENAGFEDVDVERTTFTGADVTLPADSVVETEPQVGEVVPVETPVVITANPDVDHMPVVVPSWVGQPMPAELPARIGVTVTVLPEDQPDPRYGPLVVTQTTPQSGERVVPDTWPAEEPLPEGQPTTVQVTTNPQTAPDPAAPGALFTPPPVPPIDFGPLNQLTPCTVFPFGVACWVKGALEQWVGTPVTPEWHFEFPYSEDGFTVSLELFDPLMPEIRAVILFAAIGAMVWLFVGLAWGSIGGGRNEKD